MATLRSALSAFTVSVNGVVDIDSTLKAVKSAWIAECEASAARDIEIETSLNNAFTSLGVSVYPTPEIVAIASATLVNGELTKMAGVADEVREYLSRSNKFKGERGRKGGLRKL